VVGDQQAAKLLTRNYRKPFAFSEPV